MTGCTGSSEPCRVGDVSSSYCRPSASTLARVPITDEPERTMENAAMGRARSSLASTAERIVLVCSVLLLVSLGSAFTDADQTPPAVVGPVSVSQLTPPPTPPSTAPAAPMVPSTPNGVRFVFGDYRIQPGDRLHMSVWGEPSLTTETTVLTHGQVAFPLLGELESTGKSVAELTEDVRTGYLRYYKDPRVSLFVTPAVWPSVYVQGNVRNSGPVDYTPGRRLLDYVGMAGGFGADADLSGISIVRREGDTTSSTTVDMSAVSFQSESVPNPELQPGDTVWVGKALPVSVLGQVNRPGAVEYRHGLRLSDYVGMAGGPTNRATLGAVSLKHTNPDGTSSVAQFDLVAALAQPEDPELNPVLAPGDTVTVPERFVAGTLEWSEILRAVAGVIIWR